VRRGEGGEERRGEVESDEGFLISLTFKARIDRGRARKRSEGEDSETQT